MEILAVAKIESGGISSGSSGRNTQINLAELTPDRFIGRGDIDNN